MTAQFLSALTNFVSLPQNYLQILITLCCVAISLIVSYLTKAYILSKIEEFAVRRKNRTTELINKYFGSLFNPILLFVLLSTAMVVSARIFSDVKVIWVATQFSLLWAIVRFVNTFSASDSVAKLVAIVLTPVVILNIFDLVTPTMKYLDKYGVNLGSFRISVYVIIKAVVVLIVVLWTAGVISRYSKIYIGRLRGVRVSTRGLLIKFADVILYFTVFMIILNALGINLTTFAVIGGALGVGIGFGLQKITSNFISGIILLFEKSVEVDDLVELDDGTYGWIKHLGARYTLIETFDSKEIMIPNEDFITSRVTNWTYSNSKGRVDIHVGVSYNNRDLEKIKLLMIEAAKEYPLCCEDVEPECFIAEFGDSSVDFLLHFWVDNVHEGRLEPKSQVMNRIWNKFHENDIKIPFPQRDLYIKEMPKNIGIAKPSASKAQR